MNVLAPFQTVSHKHITKLYHTDATAVLSFIAQVDVYVAL